MYERRTMPAEEEVQWDTALPPGWAEAVRSWPWTHEVNEEGEFKNWLKSGPCPRCKHIIGLRQKPLRYLLPPIIAARCNCVGQHQGRPLDASRGCGVGYGYIIDVQGVS